jgi:hypothetical protein
LSTNELLSNSTSNVTADEKSDKLARYIRKYDDLKNFVQCCVKNGWKDM